MKMGASVGYTMQPEHRLIKWQLEQLKPLNLTTLMANGLKMLPFSIDLFQSLRSHHLDSGF
jgi:hypothetical protein